MPEQISVPQLLNNFKQEIVDNPDKLLGVMVSVFGSETDSTVEAVLINDELKRAGFGADMIIDYISPSTIFTNYIAEIGKPTNNFSKKNADFSYAFKRCIFDTTDRENARNGTGLISYSVVKIVKDESGRGVDSSSTGEIARINLTFRRRGKNSIVEENPEISVEVGDIGEEFDAEHFRNLCREFDRRLKQNYTIAQIIGKISENLTGKFSAIRLRERGGLYLVTPSKAKLMLDYLMAICVVVPDRIIPVLVPILDSSAFTTQKSLIAQSVTENLLTQYKKEAEKWEADIGEVENGEREAFRDLTIADAMVRVHLFRKRTAELRRTLDFDTARIEAMEDHMQEVLERAQNFSKASGWKSPTERN